MMKHCVVCECETEGTGARSIVVRLRSSRHMLGFIFRAHETAFPQGLRRRPTGVLQISKSMVLPTGNAVQYTARLHQSPCLLIIAVISCQPNHLDTCVVISTSNALVAGTLLSHEARSYVVCIPRYLESRRHSVRAAHEPVHKPNVLVSHSAKRFGGT